MVRNKKAKIHDHTNVMSFVKAPKVEINHGSTVAEVIRARADVALPDFHYNPFNYGPNRTVHNGQSVILTNCIYKKLDIKKDATVTFTCENIFIHELKIGDNVTMLFDGAANLFVNKDIKPKKGLDFNPTGHTVTLYAKKKVEVKENSEVIGNIYSKKDLKVKAKNNKTTYMTGLFIAHKVHGDKPVTWNWWDETCEPAVVVISPLPPQDGDDDDDDDRMIAPEPGIKAYPNPFFDQIGIEFTLPENDVVTLDIYNIEGMHIETLYQGKVYGDETYRFTFIASQGLPAGIYIYRLRTRDSYLSDMILLIR